MNPVADPPALRCGLCPCPNLAHTRDDGTCLIASCPCPGYALPTGTWPLMGPPNPVHGVRYCCECNRPLPENTPYSERLVALGTDSTVTETVCVYCAVEAT